jgi:formate dehydrogenase maturation protein FdhE
VHETHNRGLSCPLCTSLPNWRSLRPSCHACGGRRQVHLLSLVSAWDRTGCDCGACVAIRATWTDPPVEAVAETFAEAFARRERSESND